MRKCRIVRARPADRSQFEGKNAEFIVGETFDADGIVQRRQGLGHLVEQRQCRRIDLRAPRIENVAGIQADHQSALVGKQARTGWRLRHP